MKTINQAANEREDTLATVSDQQALISRLQAQVRTLREALRPFSFLASHSEVLADTYEFEGTICSFAFRLTIGDCRKARTALAATNDVPVADHSGINLLRDARFVLAGMQRTPSQDDLCKRITEHLATTNPNAGLAKSVGRWDGKPKAL